MANNAYGTSFSSFAFAPTEPAQAAEKVRRHPKYYLNGGDIHFLVENYIFRVHRYFFERESQIFREWLGVPPAPGQQPRGSSDANPYPLDDVREEDFSRFLWVFYNPKYSVYDANDEEWTSILKLSHTWDFPEVKRLSIRYIEDFELEPVRKIELYQTFEVDKRLLIPSYVLLVNRPQPLTLEEGRRLGLDTALMLATARECARGKKESGKHSPVASTLSSDVMAEIIRDVFGLKKQTPASPALGPIADGKGPAAFAVTPLSPSRIVTKALPKHDPTSPSPAPLSLPRQSKTSEPSVKSPTKTQAEVPTYPLAQSISQSAAKPPSPKIADAPDWMNTNYSTPPTNGTKSTGGSKDSTRPASPTKSSTKEEKKDAKDKDAKASGAATTATQGNASKTGQSPVSFEQKPQPVRTTSSPLPASPTTSKHPQPPQTPNQPSPSSPTLTRKKARDPVPPPETAHPAPSISGLLGSKAKAGMAGLKAKAKSSWFGRDESPTSGYQKDVTSTAGDAGIAGHEFNELDTKDLGVSPARVESSTEVPPAHADKTSDEVKAKQNASAAPPRVEAAEEIKPAVTAPAPQESVAPTAPASHEAPAADVQNTTATANTDSESVAAQPAAADTSKADVVPDAKDVPEEPAKLAEAAASPTTSATDLFSDAKDADAWDFSEGPIDTEPPPAATSAPQEDLMSDAVLVQTADATAATEPTTKPPATLSVSTEIPPARELRESAVQTAIGESQQPFRILTPRSASAQTKAMRDQAVSSANPVVRTLSNGKDAAVQSAVEPGDEAKAFAETIAKSGGAEVEKKEKEKVATKSAEAEKPKEDKVKEAEKKVEKAKEVETKEPVKSKEAETKEVEKSKEKAEEASAAAKTDADAAGTEKTTPAVAAQVDQPKPATIETKGSASSQPAADTIKPEAEQTQEGKTAEKPVLHVNTGNDGQSAEPPAVPAKDDVEKATAVAEPETAASSVPKHVQENDDASTEGGDASSRPASPAPGAPVSKSQKKKLRQKAAAAAAKKTGQS